MRKRLKLFNASYFGTVPEGQSFAIIHATIHGHLLGNGFSLLNVYFQKSMTASGSIAMAGLMKHYVL